MCITFVWFSVVLLMLYRPFSVNRTGPACHWTITTVYALDSVQPTTIHQDIAQYNKMLYDLGNLRMKVVKLYNASANYSSPSFARTEVQTLRQLTRVLTLRSIIWYKANIHHIPSRHIPQVIPSDPQSLIYVRELLRYKLYTDGLLSVRQRDRLTQRLNQILCTIFVHRAALYHQLYDLNSLHDSEHNGTTSQLAPFLFALHNNIRQFDDSPFQLPITPV